MSDNMYIQKEIDTETAEKIYRHLYKTLGNAIGFQVARDIIGMGEDEFDPDKAEESLNTIINTLAATFGRKTASNMVIVTIRSEFEDEISTAILSKINFGNIV